MLICDFNSCDVCELKLVGKFYVSLSAKFSNLENFYFCQWLELENQNFEIEAKFI